MSPKLCVRGVVVLSLAVLAGCSHAELKTPDRLNRGLVIVLPGIEGRSIWNENLVRGLEDANVRQAIEVHQWGTPIPGGALLNLADVERNRGEAARLRDKVLDYRQSYPGRPVQLVGHSAGAGIAVMTAEMMPPGQELDRLVLLAAAISPDYNLGEALARTDRGIYNCFSEMDNLFLGPGTVLFGTVDRKHTESAGKVGFRMPPGLSGGEARQYDKLHQLSWNPKMVWIGHDGGHFGWAERGFVRQWVAGLVKSQPAMGVASADVP